HWCSRNLELFLDPVSVLEGSKIYPSSFFNCAGYRYWLSPDGALPSPGLARVLDLHPCRRFRPRDLGRRARYRKGHYLGFGSRRHVTGTNILLLYRSGIHFLRLDESRLTGWLYLRFDLLG